MKQFRLNLKNKIKNSKGMSLSEILVTIIIMLLATAVLTTVVSLGVRQYTKTLSSSEANTLYSTLRTVISDELAYIDPDTVSTESSGNISYTSRNYGSKCKFTLDDGKVKIGNDSSSVKLLGDGSYPHNLKVQELNVTYDDGMFNVTIKIGRNSEPYIDDSFQVINTNIESGS